MAASSRSSFVFAQDIIHDADVKVSWLEEIAGLFIAVLSWLC
jgi:hypothetical protein